jgi:4-hydroxybenzoate polyprenyltransferase
MRFGSSSCLLLALASVGALFLALVAAAFPFDLPGMKRFDPTNIVYGFSYFVLPLAALAATFGQTLFVIWVVRYRGRNSQEGLSNR